MAIMNPIARAYAAGDFYCSDYQHVVVRADVLVLADGRFRCPLHRQLLRSTMRNKLNLNSRKRRQLC